MLSTTVHIHFPFFLRSTFVPMHHMDDSFPPGGIPFDDILELGNEARDMIATYRGKWPKEKMSSFSSTRAQTRQHRGAANIGTFWWHGSIISG